VINKLSQTSSAKSFINYRDSKLTRILQPALGGNSKTAIICTITQTLINYQESVNTLLFGQKAKHVKMTINVNEVWQGNNNPEMEKAMKEISELKTKLKEYQDRIVQINTSSIGKSLEEEKNNMSIDSNEKSLMQTAVALGNNDMTILFLKDQLAFLQKKVQNANDEVEEK